MKLLKSMLTIPLLLGVLYACNDGDQDEIITDTGKDTVNDTANNNADQNNGTDQNATDDQNEGEEHVDTPYNFTHFDLDVEYDNDVSYDVEYANDQKGMSAEFEDERNNIHSEGDDAYNKIVKYLELLTFNANTEDEEVLSQVITAFELDENYTSFELEVKFNNGEVKRYNFTNQ